MEFPPRLSPILRQNAVAIDVPRRQNVDTPGIQIILKFTFTRAAFCGVRTLGYSRFFAFFSKRVLRRARVGE